MDTVPRIAAASDLELGTKVEGYVIDGKLGEGGFGTVFAATHPLIGKRAAVKVLSRKYSSDPEVVSRFAAEARAVNQIRHRNIIDIFAFGQLDDGRSYYVMELLEGQPLDKVIDERGGLPVDEAVPILRELARALDAAHAKGIAHRDLKPENVFLVHDEDGTLHPKLLDFGIAKLLGEANQSSMHRTRTGSPIGTPYYMSPEQCRGQATIDHRTDIYSFGCVAYQLLTGRLPFEGENHLEILMKQTTEEPVAVSEKAAQNPALQPLPSAVDDAIAWMMRKDPAERPPSLAEAVMALEEAAGIEPVTRASDPHMLRVTPPPGRMTPTPGRLTPLPSSRTPTPNKTTTPAHGTTALGETIAATASDELARALTGDPAPQSRRRALPLVVVAVVIAAGIIVGVVVMQQGDKPVASAQPAPTDDRAQTSTAPEMPPPPSTPSVGSAAAPATSTLVTITITGVPEHTEVYGPQGPLGFAPGAINLVRSPDSIQLMLRADGYLDKQTRVIPDADKPLAVTLEPKPALKQVTTKKPITIKKPEHTETKTKPVEDPYARH